MGLVDLIPDADTLLAMEPDGLGVRPLPLLARWPTKSPLEPSKFLGAHVAPVNDAYSTYCQYPGRRDEAVDAVSAAWAWLEGPRRPRPAPRGFRVWLFSGFGVLRGRGAGRGAGSRCTGLLL